jgi:prevent-host-death family protein
LHDVSVTIRELRDNGDELVDRAARGELVTITRASRPVATLGPAQAKAVPADALLLRWRRLPPVDLARLRADIDDVVDAS